MFSASLAYCALVLAFTASTVVADPGAVQYLFSFGDSYTQTAFDINGAKPSPTDPLGNPAYPGATFSGGANWIDYLITTHNASSLLSYNFAHGGATVDASIIPPVSPFIPTLVDQVSGLSHNLVPPPEYAQWTGENSLFAIWIGINDVLSIFPQPDTQTLIGKVLDGYFVQAQGLYDAGARNFVFLGLPPIQKTPAHLSPPTPLLGSVADTYNVLLVNRVQDFAAKNQDAKATIFDTQPPFNLALSNPTAYGSPDATCVNPDGVSCLWWDVFHPGTAIQGLVAEGVAGAVGGPFFQK